MLLFTVLFIFVGGVAAIAAWLLSRRYGLQSAVTAVSLITFLSFIIAAITFMALDNKTEQNAGSWYPLALDSPVITLYFRAEGLYAETISHEEIQLAGPLPRCQAANVLFAHPEAKASLPIDTASLKLSPAPDTFSQQMTIPISYPVEFDASGVVSFGIDSQGQVWCTKQFEQGGAGGFVETAAIIFVNLMESILAFSLCFLAATILAVIVLERRRRPQSA